MPKQTQKINRKSGEGSFFFDSSRKRWRGTIRLDGRTRSVSAKTMTEARQKLKDLKNHIDSGVNVEASNMNLEAYSETFLNDAKMELRFSTYSWYEQIVRNHINPRIGKIKIKNVDKTVASSLYKKLLDSGKSETLVRHVSQALNRIMNHAEENDVILKNRCKYAKRPKPVKKTVVAWDKEEAQSFFDASTGTKFHALWVFLQGSGCRLGEALSLSWEDIDLTTGAVRITKTLTNSPGGGKEIGTMPKTASSVRDIIVPGSVLDALKEHEALQLEQKMELGGAWENLNLVFPNSLGQIMDYKNLSSRYFRPTLRKAKLSRKYKIHNFRDNFTSIALSMGVPVHLVAQHLGHSDGGRTTLEVYARPMSDQAKITAQSVETFMLN